MKLKRCCRTCKFLCPQIDSGDCYDYEENFIPMYTLINCEHYGSVDIDSYNVCDCYEVIDLTYIMED